MPEAAEKKEDDLIVTAIGYRQSATAGLKSGRSYDIIAYAPLPSAWFLGLLRLPDQNSHQFRERILKTIDRHTPDDLRLYRTSRICISGGVEHTYKNFLRGFEQFRLGLRAFNKTSGADFIKGEHRGSSAYFFAINDPGTTDYFLGLQSENTEDPYKQGITIPKNPLLEEAFAALETGLIKDLNGKNTTSDTSLPKALRLNWGKLQANMLSEEQIDNCGESIVEFEKNTGTFASQGALVL